MEGYLEEMPDSEVLRALAILAFAMASGVTFAREATKKGLPALLAIAGGLAVAAVTDIGVEHLTRPVDRHLLK